MSWKPYQINDDEIHKLGSRLSTEIDCAVRYPAYDKNEFECKCGVCFAAFVIKGAMLNNDFSELRKYHNEMKGMLK
jgi:hypothetical protein